MVQINKLSSADIWNLNYTYNEVLELYEKGEYPKAVQMAEKGLSMASKSYDVSWIYKFDDLLVKMIKTSNTANTLRAFLLKKDRT
ncbi:MAG: hypothetical protein ACFFDK_14835 [Promethearchaeota archaeon]